MIAALRHRDTSQGVPAEVATRSMMNRSTVVRRAIAGVNVLVARSGLGDTIKGTFAAE